ncbi:MAG: T9SS type A sorting domain-containing protein [Bacteroidota bacterium]
MKHSIIVRTLFLTSLCWILASFDFKLPPPPSGSFDGFGMGIDGQGWSIAVAPNGDVYVGGEFTTVDNGTVAANNIAKWDGSAWSALGSGLNGRPTDLVFDSNGKLYAAGFFTMAGGATARYIAQWDGTTWSPVGGGFNDVVYEIDIDANDHLWVGGAFTFALPNITVNRIARWDGTAWNPIVDMGIPDPSSYGTSGTIFGLDVGPSGNVWVCGQFFKAGLFTGFNRIARWNGTTWDNPGNGMISGSSPICIVEAPNGNVYVGGNFTAEGAQTVNGIMEYDGTTWNALSTGLNGSPLVIKANSNNEIIVGGGFTTAGSTTVNNLALWDGTTWNSFNNGMGSAVRNMDLDIVEDIYLTGGFITADGFNGITVNRVAKWTGVFLSAELTHFHAENQTHSVELDWSTVTENQTSGFHVQRSQDGTQWTKLGFVEASGESQTKRDYHFLDKDPLNGRAYYRLATQSLNGELDYSEIREIKRTKKNALNIFPNPGGGRFQIQGWDGLSTSYQIFDVFGRQLRQGDLNQPMVDLSDLPNGTYLLLIGDHQLQVVKQ